MDPKERQAYNFPYLHTWVMAHTRKIIKEFQESLKRKPLIPLGAPVDFVQKTGK